MARVDCTFTVVAHMDDKEGTVEVGELLDIAENILVSLIGEDTRLEIPRYSVRKIEKPDAIRESISAS